MEHLISWVEIPVKDLRRATVFYKAILKTEITEVDMFGTHMGLFPSDGTNVAGALVQGEGYTPSGQGALVYLNGGKDLQEVLDRVEKQGGKILSPKMQISPEMGYFGIFTDTEGNKIALHSIN